jgi:iron complex transport system substrate-binding protein
LAHSTPASSPVTEGTRIITDALGEVEVPANPQRVVVLDGPVLDAALTVGVTPVGATTAFANEPFPPYLGDATEGIVNVGTIQEPNLEEIIKLEPDLIIGSSFRHDKIHDQLSAIAPTVFSGVVGAAWQDDYLLFTDALNRPAERHQVLADYQARIDAFDEATQGERETWEISVVRFRADSIRVYYKTSFVGIVLEDLGLPRPESQDKGTEDERFAEISAEQVNLADGTHIFLTAYGNIEDSPLPDVTGNPLWQSLDAVKNDRVYWVDDDYWMVGIGYIAANRVMDDLTAYLIDGKAPEAIPTA